MNKRNRDFEIVSDLESAAKKHDCVVFAFVGAKHSCSVSLYPNASWMPIEVVAGQIKLRPFEKEDWDNTFVAMNKFFQDCLNRIHMIDQKVNPEKYAVKTGPCYLCNKQSSKEYEFFSGDKGLITTFLCEEHASTLGVSEYPVRDHTEGIREHTQGNEVRDGIQSEGEEGLHDGNSKPYTDANGEATTDTDK